MNAPAIAARFESIGVRIDDVVLLDSVTTSVRARGVTALLGPNGAGKSTLISVLLGLREPTHGRVALFDERLAPAAVKPGSLSAVLQDEGAFEGMTAHEYAALFAALFADRAMLDRILDECALPREREHTRLDRLSGGELRRLQLAASLATDPRLLVLDEPTNHLDPAARKALLLKLRAQGQRRAVLVATHDLHEAARIADAVIVLVGGRVRAHGALDELLATVPEPLRSRGIEGLFEHCTGSVLDASGSLSERDEDATRTEQAR
jgi:ABC-2 type transport system ATP-binding protein